MKTHTLSFLIVFVVFNLRAQIIIDTVSIGPGYANQVWYSLENDDQGTQPKTNWDLAFECSGQGTSILINSVIGTTLWQYPKADSSGWNTFDTLGLSTWSKRWNSDTSWSMGAMGRYASVTDPNDLDWGIYNSITHFVTGDSLYLIKLASGSYKKLQIRSLISGVFNFRYADLNGANLINATVAKTNFTGQNFGYYSLVTNTTVTREPASVNWDLLFTQYTTFIPIPYTVTGMLQNKGVKVAEVRQVANSSAYVNWPSHTFNTAINVIGYDWKTFTTGYIIEDSLVYFVKAKDGDIWKVIPTGFGGGANGNFIFSKEKLSAVGIKEENGNIAANLAVYPNPSSGNEITILLSANELSSVPVLSVYNMSGNLIKETILSNAVNNQLNVFHLDAEDISNGVYMVDLRIGNTSAHQKLIINK